MKVFSYSDTGIVDSMSLTGTHTIDFYNSFLVASDQGGILTSSSNFKMDYTDAKVTFEVLFYNQNGSYELVISDTKTTITLNINLEEIFRIISHSTIKNITFTHSKKHNALIKTTHKIYFVHISFNFDNLYISFDNNLLQINIIDIKSLRRENENFYLLVTTNGIFSIATNHLINDMLNGFMKQISFFKKFTNKENLFKVNSNEMGHYLYIENQTLFVYQTQKIKPIYEFNIPDTEIYMGQSIILLKDSHSIFHCSNQIVKKLTTKLKKSLYLLHEFASPNLIRKPSAELRYGKLVGWIEQNTYYLYDLSTDEIIHRQSAGTIKVSSKDHTVLILKNALLKTGNPIDRIKMIDTPDIVYSNTKHPVFYERKSNMISFFIPNHTLYEDSIDDIYKKETKDLHNGVEISINKNLNIVITKEEYKNYLKIHYLNLECLMLIKYLWKASSIQELEI